MTVQTAFTCWSGQQDNEAVSLFSNDIYIRTIITGPNKYVCSSIGNEFLIILYCGVLVLMKVTQYGHQSAPITELITA
jgi:hypothetical protein